MLAAPNTTPLCMLSTVFLPMARTGALVAMPFSRLVPFTSASRLMKTPGMMLTPCTVLCSSTAVIFVAVPMSMTIAGSGYSAFAAMAPASRSAPSSEGVSMFTPTPVGSSCVSFSGSTPANMRSARATVSVICGTTLEMMAPSMFSPATL